MSRQLLPAAIPGFLGWFSKVIWPARHRLPMGGGRRAPVRFPGVPVGVFALLPPRYHNGITTDQDVLSSSAEILLAYLIAGGLLAALIFMTRRSVRKARAAADATEDLAVKFCHKPEPEVRNGANRVTANR